MSEKRKDKKGRILKDGESQRKNGSYDYRYTDRQGKRRSVYATTLVELREKEKQIQRDLEDGIDYTAGDITVIELVERYLAQKHNIRNNTKNSHRFVFNLIKNEDFAFRCIKDIKTSDAKIFIIKFIIKLYNDGYKYSTIRVIRGVLRVQGLAENFV